MNLSEEATIRNTRRSKTTREDEYNIRNCKGATEKLRQSHTIYDKKRQYKTIQDNSKPEKTR